MANRTMIESAVASQGVAPDWEHELSTFLSELSELQAELLAVLQEKRARLATPDQAAIASLQSREEALNRRLEECQTRRGELLAAARKEGLPSDSISTLARAMPAARRDSLSQQVKQSAAKMRLLQHQSLTNWVLAQRSLLHVSQLLEIIATGGRPLPTYGDNAALHSRGGLVNQEA
jgi:flagellar biosynthesis/type III secretory pathway chaperone